MTVLQTVKKIRVRLGYEDIEVVNDAIEVALESASVQVEDAIRTSLARATVVDLFYVIQSKYYEGRYPTRRGTSSAVSIRTPFLQTGDGTTTELKLTRGFVDSGETITVYAANSLRNVNGTGEGTRFDLKDPDDFTLLEEEKGVMRVQDYDLSGLYVQVGYTAGFATDGGTPEMYELATNQEWLREVAALKATILLDGNPVVRNEPMDERALKALQDQLDSLFISRSRYAPGAWKPHQTAETLV